MVHTNNSTDKKKENAKPRAWVRGWRCQAFVQMEEKATKAQEDT